MTLPSNVDGANTNSLTDDFSAEDAFLKRFLPTEDTDADDEDQPSDEGKDEDTDSTPADDEDTDDTSDQDGPEGEDGDDEDGEETAKDKRKYTDSDETYVKIKVEDVEHEVSVKDLKRLWGQEAALTQKSQKVADQRKAVEAAQERNVAATEALLQRAYARFEPYAKVDFLLASRELSPEEYTALRDEAQRAYDDVKFLQTELDGYIADRSTKEREALVEQAKATIQELSDPEKGIEGWSEKVYDDIRAYAVTQGVDQSIVNQLVDASAIRILHKAMLFDRGKSKVVTKKVNKTPKKIVKTSTNSEVTKSVTKDSANRKATERLRKEGTTDAAADAFLAMWSSDDE